MFRFVNSAIKRQFNSGCRISRDILKMRRAYEAGNRLLCLFFHEAIYRRYSCCISPLSKIAPDVIFPHPCGVVIGEGTVIGMGCTIYQQVTIGQKNNLYPQIGNDVTIYPGARVIGGIRVEKGAVIGANAVVLHDVPAYAIVAGVPATVKSYKMLQGGRH